MAPLKRDYFLSADSSTRDTTLYPLANSYVLPLENTIPGVESIEIDYALIPISEYTINQDNRYIDLTIDDGTGSDTYNISLGASSLFDSDGNGGISYTPANLGTHIVTQINAETTNPVLTSVTYSTESLKFTYTWTAAVVGNVLFKFGSGLNKLKSAALLMGFDDDVDTTLTAPASSATISPNITQISGPPEVLMVMEDGGDSFTQITGPQKESEFRVTARFPLAGDFGDVSYFKENDDFNITYDFYEGSKFSLNEIRLSFYKSRLGKLIPYNFNGLEHTIQFKIKGFTDKMMISEQYRHDKRIEELPPPIHIPGLDIKNDQLIAYISICVLLFGVIMVLLKKPKQ